MKTLLFKYLIALILTLSIGLNAIAGEGMWLPHLIAALNEDEMRDMGMKMTAEDIYNVNKGSLKDAIVHFGGFCTGEIISYRGLLLTNHHCGYGQIQAHSSVERNLLRDGYWAVNMASELPNPGLYAQFIERIEDVTEAILNGVEDDISETHRTSIIDKNINALRESYPLNQHQELIIKPFFHGNQYISFVVTKYPDVRLVGAPPEAIGKFGHDTDNWVWPRHTGDFSLFRVYTAPDGSPAEYADENVPLQPKHALPISLDGIDEGDFTLVFGFPGSTNEYLPASAVDQIANQVNPVRIACRETIMKVMDAEMKSDEEIKIKYASKYSRLANYWKKWIGESRGLKQTHALERIREDESKFNNRLAEDEVLQQQYGDVLNKLDQLYSEMTQFKIAEAVQSEAFSRNIDMISLSNIAQRLANIYTNNGEEAFEQAKQRYIDYLADSYGDYDSDVDLKVAYVSLQKYKELMPVELMTEKWNKAIDELINLVQHAAQYQSLTYNPDDLFNIIENGALLDSALSADPVRQLVTIIQDEYNEQVAQKIALLNEKSTPLMRQYMDMQLVLAKDKKLYPDANSTMRITYGQVKGYEPRDAVHYMHQSFLEGAMQKYKPGDWEFDLPQRLIDLYNKKDYGIYGQDGRLPLCFIGSNHTTGGNSGSPAIDAYGNLIGLNFDRVWEGTMSDYYYDASICRNIMVDVRFILFVIDKYAEAGHLIDEMQLVHPKQ